MFTQDLIEMNGIDFYASSVAYLSIGYLNKGLEIIAKDQRERLDSQRGPILSLVLYKKKRNLQFLLLYSNYIKWAIKHL